MCKSNEHASKYVAKAEVNLNWLWTIDYGLLSLHIWIHGSFSPFDTGVLTVFLFLCFLRHLLEEYEEHETWWKHQYRILAKVLLFVKNCCFKEKLSFLINTLFGYVLQTAGVIGLMQLYAKPWCQKSISTPGKSIF